MATFSTAFGSLPATSDALGLNNNTKAVPTLTGQQPGQQGQAKAQGQQAQQRPPTFAELQKQGQARPAPPPAPAPVIQSGGSAADLRAALLQQINAMMAGTDDPSFAAQAAVKKQELGAEFGAKEQTLNEELARRGLSASTIGAGRFGDLAGQQARAVAMLEAEVMRQQAEAKARDRAAGFQGLTSLAQMTGDIEMRAAELQQQAELEGRSLDLTAARDAATKELGYADLAYKREALQQEKLLESARLDEARALRLQNLGISQAQLDMEAKRLQQEALLRGRELDLAEARDLAEIEYRAKQLQLEDRRLTSEEAREKARQELERDRMSQDNENARLDRELRQTLGLGQQEIDRLRASQEGRAFLVQLAQLIGGIDKLTPEQLAYLGIKSTQTDDTQTKDDQTDGGDPGGPPGGGRMDTDI